MCSNHDEHGSIPLLDGLAADLRVAPAEPPAGFMAAVRKRRRRVVAGRIAGAALTTAAVAIIAAMLIVPALRSAAPGPAPIVTGPRAPSHMVPTAGALRRFIDDPTVLDGAADVRTPGLSGEPVRAGERPDSPAARSLLEFN
jgi:hypothetical protein